MDWNLDKYRSPHDSSTSWNMKREFMELNRGSYEEIRLASLAEVFVCSRMLGCRYPKETMDLVDSLSKEITSTTGGSIRRTLVPYSRLLPGSSSSRNSSSSPGVSKYPMFVKSEMETEEYREEVPIQEEEPKDNFQNLCIKEDPLSTFIIFERINSDPRSILCTSSQFNCIPLEWKFEPEEVSLTINGVLVCSVENTSERKVKVQREVSVKALEVLKTRCHTIRLLKPFLSDFPEVQLSDESNSGGKKDLSTYGIGFKLLKSMGWSETESAKKNEGNRLPFDFFPEYNQMQRNGLGKQLGKNEFLDRSVVKKIEEYARSNSKLDLAFSADFSKEQRIRIHNLANKYNLKSRSSGNNKKRRIILSRKIDDPHLLKYLIKNGEQQDKYEVISPISA